VRAFGVLVSRVSALCGAPLTGATIGIYTFATVAGFVEVVGITERNGAIG